MKPRPKTIPELYSKQWPKYNQQTQKSEYISRMQHELALYLPEPWGKEINVDSYKNGVLVLQIENAAVKTRFNQYRSQLMSQLRQKFPDLITIKEQIVPKNKTKKTIFEPSSKKAMSGNKMSHKTREELHHLAESMPDGIKNALANLIETASGKKK